MAAIRQRIAQRGGLAVIVLRDGREYEGDVQVVSGFVHFDGRRRVKNTQGVTYRPAGARSWPHQRILEIRWLDIYQPETRAAA